MDIPPHDLIWAGAAVLTPETSIDDSPFSRMSTDNYSRTADLPRFVTMVGAGRIMKCSKQNISLRSKRGTLLIKPVGILDGKRVIYSEAAVFRAAQILPKRR